MTQNFSVRAEITGGVSDEFRQSVVASSQNLTRFAENTTDLVRTQRTAERSIARTTRRVEFLNQELEDTQEGSKAAAQLTKQIGTANRAIRQAEFVLADVNEELSEMKRRAEQAAEAVQDVAKSQTLWAIARRVRLKGLVVGLVLCGRRL